MAGVCSREKCQLLENKLKGMGRIVLAYSGGVDSDFLLAAAKKSGAREIIAVTVASDFVTGDEIQRARMSAGTLGVELVVLEEDILQDEAVVVNSARRCYFCKHRVFGLIKGVAEARGISHLIHGVNLDDHGDYRPGLEAALELGFDAPLAELGFTKAEIRACAREMGLASWDLPSQSCLATRIPYGERITHSDLEKIGRAEALLRRIAASRTERVRVRCHGPVARIEVETATMEKIMLDPQLRLEVSQGVKALGFTHVSLDLDGYVTGNMNQDVIKEV